MQSKKVMVKTWIPGFTDTATITKVVSPTDTVILSPNLNFNDNALYSLTSAKKSIEKLKFLHLRKTVQYYFIPNRNQQQYTQCKFSVH